MGSDSFALEPITHLLEDGNEQFKRSFRSFVTMILDIYQQRGGKGKTITDFSVDLHNVGLTHKEGYFALPPGQVGVNLAATNAEGPDDQRVWNSSFIAREAADGKSVYEAKLDNYIAGQNADGTWTLVGTFEQLLDETP